MEKMCAQKTRATWKNLREVILYFVWEIWALNSILYKYFSFFFSSYQFTPCLAIMPLRRRGILGMKENEKWIGIPILSRNQEIKLYSWSKDRGIKPDNRWIYRLLLLDKKNVFIVCFVFFSLSKNIIMPTSVM